MRDKQQKMRVSCVLRFTNVNVLIFKHLPKTETKGKGNSKTNPNPNPNPRVSQVPFFRRRFYGAREARQGCPLRSHERGKERRALDPSPLCAPVASSYGKKEEKKLGRDNSTSTTSSPGQPRNFCQGQKARAQKKSARSPLFKNPASPSNGAKVQVQKTIVSYAVFCTIPPEKERACPMKKTLFRLIVTLAFLALYASQPLTTARADGGIPYPPICPSGPCIVR